jgi:DNA-binding protein H-NS
MAYQSFEIAQLRAKQEALDKQLAEAKERETRLVLIEIVQKMREYGISLNELMGRKMGSQPVEPTAKYRDPVSGATWSGRGRAPQWIAGKNRDEFLTDTSDNGDKRPTASEMVQALLFPNER